jgi:hypothetical protein
MTSKFAPLMLRPMAAIGVPAGDAVIVLAFAVAGAAAMAAIGVPPGDKGIALAFAVTAAVAEKFVGGEVGVHTIVGMARRELVLINLCEY